VVLLKRLYQGNLKGLTSSSKPFLAPYGMNEILRIDGDNFNFINSIRHVISAKGETDLDCGDTGLGIKIGLSSGWCGSSDRLLPLTELLLGQGVDPQAMD
jgi:hypothetical protein